MESECSKCERNKKLINELKFLLVNANRIFVDHGMHENKHVKLWQSNVIANEAIRNSQAELDIFLGRKSGNKG